MFISNAYAEAAATTGGGIMDFLPLIALIAVFYFLILRPQFKRAKEQKAMITALQRGDEVVTTGGEVGTAMVWVGLAMLVLIPALNVVAVLLDEWSAKPRTFAFAAASVLVLLVVSTAYKIWKA